jgi:hypothetical protein
MVLSSNGSKFIDKLKIVIYGNGLNNDSPVHFNVTRSSLKGKALCIFNDKATWNKKKRQWIFMFNVSKLLWNMCSLLTIPFSNRKPLWATM